MPAWPRAALRIPIAPNSLMPYTNPIGECGTGNGMSLFNDMFDTRTLTRIIGALAALLVMKAISSYLGFSWVAALERDGVSLNRFGIPKSEGF